MFEMPPCGLCMTGIPATKSKDDTWHTTSHHMVVQLTATCRCARYRPLLRGIEETMAVVTLFYSTRNSVKTLITSLNTERRFILAL